jgi:hypothetical protein
MKKIFLVALPLLYFLAAPLDAQIAVGYNTDGNTLSVSADICDRFTGELRINTKYYNQASWSYNDRGITQLYVLAGLFSTTDATLYAGAGLGINLLSEESGKWVSINIPVGIMINPFSKLPNLFITGEYDPMLIAVEGVPVIHCISAGFRYKLIRGE